MTLQNGLIHRRKAFLWTDTALWDDRGAFAGEAQKAMIGIAWPWAATLTATCPPGEYSAVAVAIGTRHPKGPASLLDAAVGALEEHAARGYMGRLLVAFPDATHGARMFFVATDDTPIAKPFEPVEQEAFLSSGHDHPEIARRFHQGLSPTSMRKVISLQAGEEGETAMGWRGRSIGGNIIETCVSRGGVKSRVRGNLHPFQHAESGA